MFSKLFSKKSQSEDIEHLLAQARRHLWRNELQDAKQLFEQANIAIKKHIKKSKSNIRENAALHQQAQLGLWAISYLNDPERRIEVEEILSRQVINVETVAFIARVFQSQQDTSLPALQAYHRLLELNTSAKQARNIADILKNVTFSPDALDLLIGVVQILPDDFQIVGQLIRWYLRASYRDKAEELAYRILRHDPSNQDANRCLAVKAEQRQDWETAAIHYRAAHDYLRLAVVLIKLNWLTEANEALSSVSENERKTPTWLYHRGWVAFQQNDIASTLKHWTDLEAKYPEYKTVISNMVQTVKEHVLYGRLHSFDFSSSFAAQDYRDSPYLPSVLLQVGAAKLMLDQDISGSKALFQQAAHARRDDLKAITFLLLQQTLEKNDETSDIEIYKQLTRYFQDASLFMWLRGLMLLRNGQSTGQKYLVKAYQDGICDRHLPVEAVQAVNWLDKQLLGDQAIDIAQGNIDELQLAKLNGSTEKSSQFLWAIAPSYTLTKVPKNGEIKWIDIVPSDRVKRNSWSKVQTVYHFHHKNWAKALTQLAASDITLKERMVFLAIQDAANQKDWLGLAEYVQLGLDIVPNNHNLAQLYQHLRPQMQQILWQRKEFETLDFELEKQVRSGNASTAIYHGMALVYTQLAIAKDFQVITYEGEEPETVFTMEGHRTQAKYTGILEDEAHNDYWQLAIGYWTVALSDESYWQTWATRRSEIYGEVITNEQIHTLTEQTIPHLLQEYHKEQINNGSPFVEHHRFYEAIIDHGIERTKALRYLIRVAERQNFALPSGIIQFISPLLIKEYGYAQQAQDVIDKMSSLRLSPYEAELIRSSFSPLSDVKALVSIKEYDMALRTLRKLMVNQKYAYTQGEIRQELCHVLELSAVQVLDLELWDKALDLSTEGMRIQPLNRDFENLSAKAVIGWANKKLGEEEFSLAVQKLETVRSQLKHRHSDLDELLSVAYIEWAREAARDEDLDTGIRRCEKALDINKSNLDAKSVLWALYHDRAAEKAQAGSYIAALSDANNALKHQEREDTLRLIAMIHRSIAVQNAESNKNQLADKHWSEALKYASKFHEENATQNSMNFYVEIGIGYMVFLYSNQIFAGALELGQHLITLPYDPSAFNVNLNEMLSTICTDYGASLYNNGNRWQGRQIMEKALEYDPTNQVARNNLIQCR